MKVQTHSLTDAALDWAVCKASGMIDSFPRLQKGKLFLKSRAVARNRHLRPTECWEMAGPIIEQEHIGLISPTNKLTMFWTADIGFESKFTQFDHDPLIASMRCYVASKLGDEVDVPEELCQ